MEIRSAVALQKETEMSTYVTIELRAKKGMGNDLVSVFKQFTPIARGTEGNLSIQLMQDQDDPDLLKLYQRWESREHQEKYLVQWRERGNNQILDPFLDGEPDTHYFHDTGV